MTFPLLVVGLVALAWFVALGVLAGWLVRRFLTRTWLLGIVVALAAAGLVFGHPAPTFVALGMAIVNHDQFWRAAR